VVLLGDGHYDPKNNLGYGKGNFIPPYLAFVDPWVELAADNRYVTIVGEDNLPDMMLGRLAVNTSAEASAMVNKNIAYETAPGQEDWRSQLLAVTDNTEPGNDFYVISDDLITNNIPDTITVEKIYYLDTHLTAAEAKQAIIDGINAGKFIVNYIGHGGTSLWAGEQIFRTSDIPFLTNSGKLHVMLLMTCDNGKYSSPNPSSNADSMAEVITKTADYGAVASWAPTGKGYAFAHKFLERGFFNQLFDSGESSMPIGLATSAGKTELWGTGDNLDLLDTYLLFGDPATLLQIPLGELPAPSNLSASAISSAQIDLGWTDNSKNETGFKIERSLNGTDGWEQIAQVGADVTVYSDLGLDPDTTYYYRIRAFRTGDDQYSEYTNIDDARTEQRLFFFLPLIVVPGP
jgi:hypothetical protein